jgi:hypothetical protein
MPGGNDPPLLGAGQGVQGASELAVGVGVAPRGSVHEDGGDRRAELTGAGGAPGPLLQTTPA